LLEALIGAAETASVLAHPGPHPAAAAEALLKVGDGGAIFFSAGGF
jgi:hypothetical protein